MSKEIAIQEEISPLVAKAAAMKIKTPEDLEEAVEMLSEVNKAGDRITEEKEKVTKPLNEALKAERSRWKPAEEKIEQARSILRTIISAYQTKQKQIADAKAAKIADKVASGEVSMEKGMAKMDAVTKPEEKVETGAGKVMFRTVRKFEVVDMKKLPIKYHLPDESAIRAALKAGTELAGVRYWDEEQPINYR